jgi:hypothetical protein
MELKLPRQLELLLIVIFFQQIEVPVLELLHQLKMLLPQRPKALLVILLLELQQQVPIILQQIEVPVLELPRHVEVLELKKQQMVILMTLNCLSAGTVVEHFVTG